MDLIRRQRVVFTVIATVMAAIFLLLLLGGFFVITLVSNDSFLDSALQKALASPNNYNKVSPQNMRCIFVYVSDMGGADVVKGDTSYYGDKINDVVAEAKNVANGKFHTADRYFVVASEYTATGALYAILDRTDLHNQLFNTGMLMVLLYCCALLLTSLIAYLISAKMLQPVSDAMSKQRDLTANASHELKTPLTVIAANLSVIKSEPDSTVKDNDHWIESIDSQIVRMQDLIQSMLELSKLETSELPMTEQDLSQIAEGVCLSFEPVCFEKGVSLASDIKPNIKVAGDRASLERLISILIDNAIKYCGDHGKIGLSLFIEQKKVKLNVMNTGESITKEEAEHVFDRFYRTDGARKNEDKHSFGLGLSIAAATVRAHGGAISCHGVENKGSVFNVVLPIYKAKRQKAKHAKN